MSNGIGWLRISGLVCLLTAALPADAQQTTFNPVLTLSYGYTDNVGYVDDGGGDLSDSSAQLAAGIGINRTIKNGALNFDASARYTQYDEADVLDHPTYGLGFSANKTRGRGSFGFTSDYSRSQDQARADAADDADISISRRTTREQFSAGGSYGHQFAEGRWQLSSGIGATLSEFDEISGTSGGDPVGDRTSYRANLGFGKVLDRRTIIGGEYSYRTFDLDDNLDEEVNGLSFTLSHEASRKVSFNFRIGAFHRSQDTPAGKPDNLDSEDYMGSMALARRFKSVGFSVILSRNATAGGAEDGTSTNTSLALALSSDVFGSAWNWRTAVRAARHDPSISTDPSLDTVALSASVGRRVGRVLNLSLGGSLIDQSSDDVDRDGDGYYTVGIGLTWRPLGNRARQG